MSTDPFAVPPHRPSHPDFAHLSEIVLQLDGVAVESGIPDGEVLPHEVGKHADVESVVYMAVMRSIKAKEQANLSPTAQVVASAMWMDGWLAGVRFQQRYNTTPIEGLAAEDQRLIFTALQEAANHNPRLAERMREVARLIREAEEGRRAPEQSRQGDWLRLEPDERDLLRELLRDAFQKSSGTERTHTIQVVAGKLGRSEEEGR
jgi:hypothetical protein